MNYIEIEIRKREKYHHASFHRQHQPAGQIRPDRKQLVCLIMNETQTLSQWTCWSSQEFVGLLLVYNDNNQGSVPFWSYRTKVDQSDLYLWKNLVNMVTMNKAKGGRDIG